MTENLFGKNLVLYRRAAGLTQKELAQKIGISPTTLAGYENAGKDPKIMTLIKMADVFGVSVDCLVRESPPEIKESLKLRDELLKIAVKSFEQFDKTNEPVQVKLEIVPPKTAAAPNI